MSCPVVPFVTCIIFFLTRGFLFDCWWFEVQKSRPAWAKLQERKFSLSSLKVVQPTITLLLWWPGSNLSSLTADGRSSQRSKFNRTRFGLVAYPEHCLTEAIFLWLPCLNPHSPFSPPELGGARGGLNKRKSRTHVQTPPNLPWLRGGIHIADNFPSCVLACKRPSAERGGARGGLNKVITFYAVIDLGP